MLGLPDGTRACLFDLDGVLTDTASVHAAAWKQMFDDYLRARAERDGHRVRAVRRQGRLRPLRGRQAAAGRHRQLPALAAASSCPGRPGRPAGHRDDPGAVHGQERPGPGEDRHRRGGRLPGLGALPRCRAGRRAEHRRRVVLGQRRAGAGGRRSRPPDRPPGRRGQRQGAQPAGQAGPGHVPGRGRPTWASSRRRRSCSRTRWPASRPGKAGGFGSWSAWTGSGRPRRCARTAPTSSCPTWPSCWTAQHEPRSRRPFTVEPWVVREPRLDLDAIGQAESVFALSNGHIGLRGNLDEGEPHAMPGHLPELLLRAPAAALRRGRLRLPRVRADDHQRDQRQADPAAGRGRTVRPALRPGCAGTSGCWTCRPERSTRERRVGVAGRAGGAGAQHPDGVADPAGDRRHLLRGRGPRRARRCWCCSPSWWPTRRCRPATKPTHGWRPRSPTRCSPNSSAATTPAPR